MLIVCFAHPNFKCLKLLLTTRLKSDVYILISILVNILVQETKIKTYENIQKVKKYKDKNIIIFVTT